MQYRITRHSASAEVAVIDARVALIRLKGLLTLDAIAFFAHESCRAAGSGARAFVLDYRKAAVMASVEQLGEMVLGQPLNSPTRLPGAYLVSPRSIRTLRDHAINLAAQGVVRRVFTHEGRAIAWAGDQAGWQRCFEF